MPTPHFLVSLVLPIHIYIPCDESYINIVLGYDDLILRNIQHMIMALILRAIFTVDSFRCVSASGLGLGTMIIWVFVSESSIKSNGSSERRLFQYWNYEPQATDEYLWRRNLVSIPFPTAGALEPRLVETCSTELYAHEWKRHFWEVTNLQHCHSSMIEIVFHAMLDNYI